MAKNTLALQLKNAEERGMRKGVLLGLDIAAIAINHTHGFGDERLSKVEAEAQCMIDEIDSAKDKDRVIADIYKELIRIRPGKESADFFGKRYFKF